MYLGERLVNTLIWAQLSFRTVHFLMNTWSLPIAGRRSPKGNSGTVIIRLFNQFLTVLCPPAGCNLPLILSASLLRVTEYAKRLVASSRGLTKAGDTNEYSWSVATARSNGLAFSWHNDLIAQVRTEFCAWIDPCGVTCSSAGKCLCVWEQDKMSLLTFSFYEFKIAEVIFILSPTVKFLIPASIFSLSKKMKWNCSERFSAQTKANSLSINLIFSIQFLNCWQLSISCSISISSLLSVSLPSTIFCFLWTSNFCLFPNSTLDHHVFSIEMVALRWKPRLGLWRLISCIKGHITEGWISSLSTSTFILTITPT